MAKYKKFEFEIHGMTCGSCAQHVEEALQQAAGVATATVPGWEAGRAIVKASPGVGAAELETAVEKAGYRARLKSEKGQRRATVPLESQGHMEGHVHLMVIGGGSAGFAAAIQGAELGYQVVLVEEGTMGGTCVNVGCIPSKALIQAIRQYHTAGHSPFKGIQTKAGDLDWGKVVAQKDELVEDLRQEKYADVLPNYPEITYIEGRARLTGGSLVEVEGVKYAPDKIVIATGASPWAPPIPGLAEAEYLTSTTAMELEDLPRSMIVLGANAVGLELGQVFSRAGVEVTLLEIEPCIAPFEDEAVSHALQGYLEEEGLQVVTNFRTQQVERQNGRYKLMGTRDGGEMAFEADQLLVATGRRPNTSGMGLEEAGVQLGERGEIVVDDALQTSNPDVYAVGDVTGREMFVYTAAYGGGLAAENALTGSTKLYETDYVARVTFTDPQVASAGLTEKQAIEQAYTVQASELPMDYVPRALVAQDTRGLIKLIADAETDKLLGAHILAPEAGEIIQTASLAIKLGMTVEDIRATLFPYLTNVEGLKLAAQAFEKDVAKLSCCAG